MARPEMRSGRAMTQNSTLTLPMTPAQLVAFLRIDFPEVFGDDTFTIEHADGKTARLRQRFHPAMLRPGRTISGPTFMMLADLTLYIAIMSSIGPAMLSVTTNLNISFLRKAGEGRDVIAEGRLLKLGKRLATGDVLMYSDGLAEPVAHASVTYSIPPAR